MTRSWTFANGNFRPDCDLANAGVQDLRSTGGTFLRRNLESGVRHLHADQQVRSQTLLVFFAVPEFCVVPISAWRPPRVSSPLRFSRPRVSARGTPSRG